MNVKLPISSANLLYEFATQNIQNNVTKVPQKKQQRKKKCSKESYSTRAAQNLIE